MAFSFSAGNVPNSSPGFSFGAASSASQGTSGGLFGSGQPAFGAASSPGLGMSTPSTTAFGGASKPSMFGAAATPSLFGTNAPQQQPSAGGGAFAFTPSSTQSFMNPGTGGGAFGGGAFGSIMGQGQQQQQQQLLTKDNRPIAHSSAWDDLSPQAQQYLLELEKVVAKFGMECKQLEDQGEFVRGEDATFTITEQATVISQNISALSIREGFDSNEVESLRKAAVHLVRHTESAVYSYKRSLAWRQITKTNASSHSLEEIGPPMVLPYPFLEETLEEFKTKLKAQLSAVYELEVTIKDKTKSKNTNPDTSLAALQSSIANLHDCVMKVAAMIQALDDKVQSSKAKVLLDMNRKGKAGGDPFREAAKNESIVRREEQDGIMKKYDDFLSIRNQNLGIPQEAPVQTGIFNTGQQQQQQTYPGVLFGHK